MDEKLRKYLNNEKKRQVVNIELIASENFVSDAILELQGSIFTNKYAEGYPGKRYYGGCENVDDVENLAIEYASKLFGAKYVNVQPHSGSSANMAVYRALLNKGDKVMGMSLDDGGHLTHGHKMSFSGQDYEIVSYTTDKEGLIDYEELRKIAIKEKPKMIIAGASAYSQAIDFKKFSEIAKEVGAILFVDMAHIAGLVAAGLHQNPVKFADVVSTTTHKTLRGPRGGMILTNDEAIIRKINKTVFPGIQGGPLMHVIAAKAQCFYEALQDDFKDYQKQVIKNMKAMSDAFKKAGFKVISGGTINHLILVDVKNGAGVTGLEAQNLLDSVYITTNKNMIPGDTESPARTSGIRVGSAAMTTKGATEEDFARFTEIIIKVLKNNKNKDIIKECREEVIKLSKKIQGDK